MSKPRIDPKFPTLPSGDDPATPLLAPGRYFDRLVRRLNELFLGLADTDEPQGSTPEIVGDAVSGSVTPDKVVAFKINGKTYYLPASSTPP